MAATAPLASLYTEATIATDKYFAPKVVDQFFNESAILHVMRKNAKLLSGGTSIEMPGLFDESPDFAWFTKAETYTASDAQTFDSASLDWKLGTVPVVIFHQDLLMNAESKQKRMDHVAQKNIGAAKTMADRFSRGMFAIDYSNSKAIDSIDRAVNDDTGSSETGYDVKSYANLTRASTAPGSLWNAKVDRASTTLGLDTLQTSYGNASEGSESPNLICSNQLSYNRYWNLLTPIQRLGSDSLGKAGFRSLLFNEVPWVIDEHIAGGANTNNDSDDTDGGDYIYMLNMNHIRIHAHKMAFFTFEHAPMPVNQWVHIGRYYFMGNVVCDAPRYQAKLTKITA